MAKKESALEILVSQINEKEREPLLLGVISALYKSAKEEGDPLKTTCAYFSKAGHKQLGKELLLEIERQSKSPAQMHFRTPKERAAFYVQRLFYTFA